MDQNKNGGIKTFSNGVIKYYIADNDCCPICKQKLNHDWHFDIRKKERTTDGKIKSLSDKLASGAFCDNCQTVIATSVEAGVKIE